MVERRDHNPQVGGSSPPSVTLQSNRHDRGWPRVSILSYIAITDQSWRYCIEPMGYRDNVWERSGYVELIVWLRK
jgi:hypothetical protein